MIVPQPYTINVRGKLMDLSQPCIMGILNVTPDSFYAESRMENEKAVCQRVEEMLDQGAQIIDIGACSTRPNSQPATAEEELARLRMGMRALQQVAPDAVVSVDTFRADIARVAVEEMGVSIVNDIAGGDDEMLQTVAQLGVPYILTHSCNGEGPLMPRMIQFFAQKVQKLREMGAKDIILDPGFGFAKTLEENYHLLHHMEDLHTLELPILVGVSRKSMVHRLLNITPEQSLGGTNVLHTIALQKGAAILRVHDVKACQEVIRIVKQVEAC